MSPVGGGRKIGQGLRGWSPRRPGASTRCPVPARSRPRRSRPDAWVRRRSQCAGIVHDALAVEPGEGQFDGHRAAARITLVAVSSGVTLPSWPSPPRCGWAGDAEAGKRRDPFALNSIVMPPVNCLTILSRDRPSCRRRCPFGCADAVILEAVGQIVELLGRIEQGLSRECSRC